MPLRPEPLKELYGLPVLTVTQLNEQARYLLENRFPGVAVTGEIADLSRPRSGHVYFTLRDAKCQVSCVLWRGLAERLQFQLADGLEVVILGRVSLYAPRGTYQIIVSDMVARGIGEITKNLEALRRKLAAEGLFAEERKRPLPFIPWTLAVITSATGAAVMDIIRTAVRRFPPIRIRVIPVRVQGSEAPAEIVDALRVANLPGVADVILLGRGGGGIEDLWAFNTEEVVRAVASSRLPVVSCVGHERDITLTDLAADKRASTPTAAAEMAVPVLEDITERLSTLLLRASRAAKGVVSRAAAELKLITARPGFSAAPAAVSEHKQYLDDLFTRMEKAKESLLQERRRALELFETRLGDLYPLAPLRKGFAIVRDSGGNIVRSVLALAKGDRLTVEFADGISIAQVEQIFKRGEEEKPGGGTHRDAR